MRTQRLVALVAVVTGISVVTGGCGDDSNSAPDKVVSNDITAQVKEWHVDVDAEHAKAGEVTFTVTNKGTIKHEFVVVKTDIPEGQIPIGPDDHFDEEGPGVEAIDELAEFAVGSTQTLKVDLEPGTYQLVCNLPEHYGNGMYREFTVTS